MTFDNLIEGQRIAFALGVLAILVAVFLLWRVYPTKAEPGNSWLNNKKLIIPLALFLILRGGYNLIKIFGGHTQEPYPPEFLYGIWRDSLQWKLTSKRKEIVFTLDHHFYSISGGELDDPDMTYNFRLTKRPIEVEINSWKRGTKTKRKTEIGTIEVIDLNHIRWRLANEHGEVIDSGTLVKGLSERGYE